jgi:uncharacterized membrane protein (UPF0136 family)
MTTSRSNQALAVPGIVLVVAFFLPWLDIAGVFGASGYDVATSGRGSTHYLYWLVPLLGAMLAATALAGSSSARSIALLVGGLVVGTVLYYMGKMALFGMSWGMWMVIAGSISLVGLAVADKVEGMAFPALLVIAGFFLPWVTRDGSFASWGATGFDMARTPVPFELGLLNPKMAYLVPLGGLAAMLGSVLGRGAAGRAIGGGAGLLVLGWMGYLILRTVGFFSGWGFWLTIAGGTAALVMALRRS